VEKGLLQQVKRRKLTYYGHIIRKTDCLEKDLIEGCTPGYRTRGRQRRRLREDISEWTGLHISVAARSAEERKQGKDVMHAAHPSTGGRH